MKNETALPQRKLRLLGNLLLLVACLGLLAGLILVPLTISLSSPPEPAGNAEVEEMIDELLLPEGVTLETTVRELLESDRAFFEENRGRYRALSFLATAFILISAAVFLRLALAWRQAVPFGRPTIIGLRCLGLLLILQFIVGWTVDNFVPRPEHSELFSFSELYQIPVDLLAGSGPILSSGILFLILSWVLDYGRKIKEEQALTI